MEQNGSGQDVGYTLSSGVRSPLHQRRRSGRPYSISTPTGSGGPSASPGRSIGLVAGQLLDAGMPGGRGVVDGAVDLLPDGGHRPPDRIVRWIRVGGGVGHGSLELSGQLPLVGRVERIHQWQ